MHVHRTVFVAGLVGVLCGIAGYEVGERRAAAECGPVQQIEKTDRVMR